MQKVLRHGLARELHHKVECTFSTNVPKDHSGTLEVGPSERALAYFLFRLLQKLQSLGTVPAIDWNAYAAVLGR